MAKCELCGKSVQFGCNVSHSHKKTNKMWRPNIQKIRVLVNNRPVRKNLCTSCIKSGKFSKAV
jgi:large subunit ribosomal protein L28